MIDKLMIKLKIHCLKKILISSIFILFTYILYLVISDGLEYMNKRMDEAYEAKFSKCKIFLDKVDNFIELKPSDFRSDEIEKKLALKALVHIKRYEICKIGRAHV